MSFIVENKVLLRKLVVALFGISMLGPWAFDLLGVPAQFPCGFPNVRLNGDFCGAPFSGFRGFIWAIRDFFLILDDLTKWHIVVRSPELDAFVSMWIIVLPFFSILLLIRYPNSQRVQIINLIVWGMACFPALRFFILQTSRDQLVHLSYLLWGVWFYIFVALGAIIFEVLVLISHIKQNMDV
jgi:hypothetical protein